MVNPPRACVVLRKTTRSGTIDILERTPDQFAMKVVVDTIEANDQTFGKQVESRLWSVRFSTKLGYASVKSDVEGDSVVAAFHGDHG
jgi:hypothetical protein